jgi:hypothetical protein
MIQYQILTCTKPHRPINSATLRMHPAYGLHNTPRCLCSSCPKRTRPKRSQMQSAPRTFPHAPAALPNNTAHLPLLVVVILDRTLGVLWPRERNKPEPARAEGIFAIHDHPRVLNLQGCGDMRAASFKAVLAAHTSLPTVRAHRHRQHTPTRRQQRAQRRPQMAAPRLPARARHCDTCPHCWKCECRSSDDTCAREAGRRHDARRADIR